ncbi:MAG: cytochrome b N-terminal domain-containing protein [Chloroflexi bacterium]|nr:cytochrome b N-terminal domain-containing protein [Chloroflexota bacterium]
MLARPAQWLEERVGHGRFFQAVFLRQIPYGVHWWYSLGAAALFLLALQTVTGILLAMNYSPTPERAYESIRFITAEVPFGWFIRGLHHWGATAMVAVVLLHLVSVFVLAAHRYPREMVWLVGVVLLLITLGFGFTGYLLPWDQKAYWATSVGTNMAGTVPVVGPSLVKLIRGGAEVGAVTLARFYAMHTLLFPTAIAGLAALHVVLIIFHGVSVTPGEWHVELSPVPGAPPEPPSRDTYHPRYAAFKAAGPRFWPDVILEDLRVALVIFLLLVLLIVFAGVPLDERADPTDTSYIPRPEWYFMALFELLKYFPGALEWVGVVAIPALLVALLVLVPWLSHGEERRPLKRPVGMALTVALLVASTGLTVVAYQATPPTKVEEGGVVLTSQQLRGRQIIQQQGCRSCHVIKGEGDEKKGPPLDGIASRLTAADIHGYMENPKARNPDAEMKPLIPPLSHEEVEYVTQYLLTLEETVTP